MSSRNHACPSSHPARDEFGHSCPFTRRVLLPGQVLGNKIGAMICRIPAERSNEEDATAVSSISTGGDRLRQVHAELQARKHRQPSCPSWSLEPLELLVIWKTTNHEREASKLQHVIWIFVVTVFCFPHHSNPKCLSWSLKIIFGEVLFVIFNHTTSFKETTAWWHLQSICLGCLITAI
jgi:uncharacterized membrane protein